MISQYFCGLRRIPAHSIARSNLVKLGFKMQCRELCSRPNIKYIPFMPRSESHQVKNERMNRPMSPHLTIYAVEITSVCSITHRLTGSALAVYWIAMSIASLALPNDLSHYIAIIEGLNLPSVVFFLIKFILAFPYAYHISNGMRHLYWDTARGLEMKEVYTTAYLMLTSATVITSSLILLF